MAGRHRKFDRTVESLEHMSGELLKNGQTLRISLAGTWGYGITVYSKEEYSIEHDVGPTLFDAMENLYGVYIQSR